MSDDAVAGCFGCSKRLMAGDTAFIVKKGTVEWVDVSDYPTEQERVPVFKATGQGHLTGRVFWCSECYPPEVSDDGS